MTTFEDYFKEHNLPLIYDDGDIDHKSGYLVGRADYDEFDDYKPILNLLSQINQDHPDIARKIEDMTSTRIELVPLNRTIELDFWNDDISISQENNYDNGFDVHMGEQVFNVYNIINYNNGTNVSMSTPNAQKALSEWFSDSERQNQSLISLLQENKTELASVLENKGYLQSQRYLTPVEWTYKRIGNVGDLKEVVATANLGKRISPTTVSDVLSSNTSELIRTPDDWLISCQDYEKDGQRYIRTHIFYDSPETNEPNRKQESAVSVQTMAYQMIPAENFATEANKLMNNFKQFNEICYQQQDKLNEKFQALLNDDTDLQTAIEELSVDEARTL